MIAAIICDICDNKLDDMRTIIICEIEPEDTRAGLECEYQRT